MKKHWFKRTMSCLTPATKSDINRIERLIIMAQATVDSILADVTDEKTVITSVVTLLENLTALLAGAGTDPAKLQAIQDLVDQNKAALAAAVVANTPGAPKPTP